MNNNAFGTIAGLELAHFGTTFGTVFEKGGESCSPDFAAIARAYGVGRSIEKGNADAKAVTVLVVLAQRLTVARKVLRMNSG